MNPEDLAKDSFRISDEKNVVTLAEQTITQNTKDSGRSGYTKDGRSGERVRIILFVYCWEYSDGTFKVG